MSLTSEYQRKYKRRSRHEVAEDYEVKLGYRTQRRLLEHRHTPLYWDATSNEDDDSIITTAKENRKDHSRSPKKEKTNDSPLKVDNAGTEGVTQNPTTSKKRVQISDESASDAVQNVVKKPATKSKDDTSFQDADKENSSHQKLDKPKRKKTRSVRRSRGADIQKIEKVNRPLIPYGMAVRSDHLEKKRTFNVLAADEIYPSALRAAKRREIETAKKSERRRVASERRLSPMLLKKSPEKENLYITEYQRNFCQDDTRKGKKNQ